jgi:GAF domain-containing protein
MLHMNETKLANIDMLNLVRNTAASLSEILPNDTATLDFYEPETGALVVQFLTPADGEIRPRIVRLPLDGSPAGAAFRTLQPVLLERMQDSPFAREAVRHLTRLGMRSGCWVPLVHFGEAIGTMSVSSRREAAFGPHEAETLMAFAVWIARTFNDAMTLRQVPDWRNMSKAEAQYPGVGSCSMVQLP